MGSASADHFRKRSINPGCAHRAREARLDVRHGLTFHRALEDELPGSRPRRNDSMMARTLLAIGTDRGLPFLLFPMKSQPAGTSYF